MAQALMVKLVVGKSGETSGSSRRAPALKPSFPAAAEAAAAARSVAGGVAACAPEASTVT